MYASLAVVLLTGILLVPAVAAFVWAYASGRLERLDEAALTPLDPEDLRLDRPWETEGQAADRRRAFGPSIRPRPGEWGGTW